jgi:hypothetical protein
MKPTTASAILMIAVLPLSVQAQQPQPNQPPSGPKPTVADVQRVVGSITSDKEKSQAYCDLVKLDDQIDQADKNKDTKQAQELSGKAGQMVQKLGPEYNALMVSLQRVDPSSQEGQQMAAAFDKLEKMCGGK